MTFATEMHPMYCRRCGLVRMKHINPPLTCSCGSTDFAYLVALVGEEDVTFYAKVDNVTHSEMKEAQWIEPLESS